VRGTNANGMKGGAEEAGQMSYERTTFTNSERNGADQEYDTTRRIRRMRYTMIVSRETSRVESS